MFVAVVPPAKALDHLEDFLRAAAAAEPGFRWTTPEQWHLTLAFMSDVAERRIDDLVDRLTRAAARRRPFSVEVTGGGAFPNVDEAKVIFAGVETDSVELGRLATGARAAVGRAGAEVAGGRFRPHVTIARTGRPGRGHPMGPGARQLPRPEVAGRRDRPRRVVPRRGCAPPTAVRRRRDLQPRARPSVHDYARRMKICCARHRFRRPDRRSRSRRSRARGGRRHPRPRCHACPRGLDRRR